MAKKTKQEKSVVRTTVGIIGTGFAGICMGIQLKKAGITDFLLLERYDDIGGTWRDNTYPGAACDVSSHMYSFSFEPKPDWSRMFSPQEEIYDYLFHCIDKYGLKPYIRFNTNITGGTFDEASGEWRLHTDEDTEVVCRYVVNGMGPLNRAVYPNIEGLETFTGTAFHSSHWDHSYEYHGKRVAVIGTGASAIQIVPALAPDVKQMYVFQRTAPWILPKADRPMTTPEKWLFRALPLSQKSLRALIYWINEASVIGMVLEPRLTKLIEKFAKKFIERSVPDTVLREKVTPNYTIGCKRILLSNDYYPALNRENVELVTSPIDRVDGSDIITADGQRHTVDAIIYGTGFDAAEYPKDFVVKGKNGQVLSELWADGPEAYLGTTVSGFPNMFLIIGPNTGLGHNSMVFMIEAQVNYIMNCLKAMDKQGAKFMDVKPEVQEKFNEDLQQKIAKTVWSSGCKSWYMTSAGKITSIWPGFTFEYWQRTRRLKPEDYEWVA